ncbi:dihydrodipicolinate synthase family protein [Orrella sp. 11846]|uniref:dihydrodipicolinate synthase family protein n=1 Tax=Orrella sp. 11846 TaxID=3409913 RepID=UPI003B593AAA
MVKGLTGLSAFPLTPMNEADIDEAAYRGLIKRLATSGVDSICALGSTGSYPYLTREERARVISLTRESASDIPVLAGIGALRTKDVLLLAEDAQKLGVDGVLLAPVSYQLLTDAEVLGLFKAVDSMLSVPLIVYNNPRTTRFDFSNDLLAEISQLASVRSIKIPAVSLDFSVAQDRITQLRSVIAPDVSIGVSGDASAAIGLTAGCDAWYSVIGGLFPETALAITRAAQGSEPEEALKLSDQLHTLWTLFAQHGALRVVAAAAELLGFAQQNCLPLPLRSLSGEPRNVLQQVLQTLDLQ